MAYQRLSNRQLPILLSLLAATLIAVLVWLTWWSLLQDRVLVGQRLQRRLETTADLIVNDLESNLSTIKKQLLESCRVPRSEIASAAVIIGNERTTESLVLLCESGVFTAYPSDRLCYYPAFPSSPERDSGTFERGERLEFAAIDYSAAVAEYTELAVSPDRPTRAGALLRIARVRRKQGELNAALEAYEQLAALDSTIVETFPADLLARFARCVVWERLVRQEPLHREAKALWFDLHRGRWRLTRAAYRFYAQHILEWLSQEDFESLANSPDQRRALALAEAVESTWEQWQRLRQTQAPRDGHRLIGDGEIPVLVVWNGEGERLAAVVTQANSLLEPLQPLVVRQNVRLAIQANGAPIAGHWRERGTVQAVRTSMETKLPWSLQVTSADPGEVSSEVADRRRLLITGLAVSVFVIIAASFAVVRSITRELDVARLQADFVSAVSHELRTPLASLCQLSELLVDGRVASDERRQTYYQTLSRECQRLRRLVESLLDFDRMEVGAREYGFETLDPTEVVLKIADEFSQEVGEKGCKLDVQIEQALPGIRGDREAIGRAIWNLLDNANKYSPRGNQVRLRADHAGDSVAIHVQDSGMGIPTDEQPRIFEKFFRSSTALKAGVKGTGLGLAMVQQIVAAHGGELKLESCPNVGSTFTIRLKALKD